MNIKDERQKLSYIFVKKFKKRIVKKNLLIKFYENIIKNLKYQ